MCWRDWIFRITEPTSTSASIIRRTIWLGSPFRAPLKMRSLLTREKPCLFMPTTPSAAERAYNGEFKTGWSHV